MDPTRPGSPLPPGLIIRPIDPAAEITQLTELLHLAYKELADMGLRYVATHQTPETTARRVAGGECYVAVEDDLLVGTITFNDAASTFGCPWYDRPDVASLHQFGVHPRWRGRGVGRALARVAEQRAAETGAAEIALDTAEPAEHLIALYTHWGYRLIQIARWTAVNYNSVILSKETRGV